MIVILEKIMIKMAKQNQLVYNGNKTRKGCIHLSHNLLKGFDDYERFEKKHKNLYLQRLNLNQKE